MMFSPVERVFPDQPMWAAKEGEYGYIITQDNDGYSASSKLMPSLPFQGTLNDLGTYPSMTAAIDACRKWADQCF